ncbi:hypothetical protein EBT25_18305, partial [bacterium]|nr:hypothetical protein [bacterium]
FRMDPHMLGALQTLLELDDLNLLLYGNPSVGKTTLLEALIREYYTGFTPKEYEENVLYINSLNTMDRGSGLRINYAPTSDPINFYTGFGTNRLSITNDGNIGMGTISPNASALLDMTSTTQGLLPPRMTTTQKNAIASPAAGLEMYDSTAKSPAYYDGTNWGYTGGALQNAAGNSGTLNISFAAGNIVNLTLNANTTLAFSNAVIGTYIIQVTQGATGANVLTYPASVKWAGGTAPTLTTTVGKTDILTFYYDGTNYYGNYSLNY